MDSAGAPNAFEKRWLLWAIAIFGTLLLLLTNLPWHLDDYDQAKQAFTSFEMVKQGHWFYQHTPRGRIATKPPLVGWISAGIDEVTRSWAIAWRLPSIAAGVALAWLLLRAGRQAGGDLGAILGLAAFFFNLLTPRLGSLVRTDMPLALVIFSIGLIIWDQLRRGQPWEARQRWSIFLLLVLGTFIKGPIVYAFLLPGLILYQIWRRRSGAPSAWPGWWPWFVSLIPLALWALIGSRFVPGFYDQVVLREFLGRFTETVHIPQPFYFYLPHLLQKFAPWSLLLLALAFARWRWRPNETKMEPGAVWLLCWIIGALLFMSVIPSKRVDRIYPLVPPLCLLVAAFPAALSSANRQLLVTRLCAASVAVAVVLTGVYSTMKVVAARRAHSNALVQFGQDVRRLSEEGHWRYETVYGGDEGMLLYLDRTAFLDPAVAIKGWNDSAFDGLILPQGDLEKFRAQLQPPFRIMLRSADRAAGQAVYVLALRR